MILQILKIKWRQFWLFCKYSRSIGRRIHLIFVIIKFAILFIHIHIIFIRIKFLIKYFSILIYMMLQKKNYRIEPNVSVNMKLLLHQKKKKKKKNTLMMISQINKHVCAVVMFHRNKWMML